MSTHMNLLASIYFKRINYKFLSIKMRSFLREEDVWKSIENVFDKPIDEEKDTSSLHLIQKSL